MAGAYSTHELLLRYDNNEPISYTFLGKNLLSEEVVELDEYIRGRFFRLPDAGVTNLEVYIQAHMTTTFNVSFGLKDQISYPGETWQVHQVVKGETALFKVRCTVKEYTMDQDLWIPFQVKWLEDTGWALTEDRVIVTVGEGSQGEEISPCSSFIPVMAASVLGMSVLLVGCPGAGKRSL